MARKRKVYKRSAVDKANKSAAQKAYWAKVRADKEAYAKRIANMGPKSPEKISAARKLYFSDPANRKNISEKRKAWWKTKTPEERSKMIGNNAPKDGESIRRYFSDPANREKHKKIMSEINARPEVRAKHSANTKRLRRERPDLYKNTAPRTWYHTLPSNREILVQSSWEIACAEALEAMEIVFERGGSIEIGSCTWRPDFLVTIKDESFYLEVKGHPLALAYFEKTQLPNIHHALIPVAILADPPPYTTDVDEFIDQLVWLHY